MKLKIKDAVNIHGTLSRLNGLEKLVDEAGSKRVVFEPFSLSGSVRSRIARNRQQLHNAFRPTQEAFAELQKAARQKSESERVALIAGDAAATQKFVQAEQDRQKQLVEEDEKLANEEVEVDVRLLDYDDLQLDKNEGITPAVIEILLPIITKLPE